MEPGTAPQRVNPGLPPGRAWVEDIDVSVYLRLDRPGAYTLTLEYEWAEDGRWGAVMRFGSYAVERLIKRRSGCYERVVDRHGYPRDSKCDGASIPRDEVHKS